MLQASLALIWELGGEIEEGKVSSEQEEPDAAPAEEDLAGHVGLSVDAGCLVPI